MLPIALNLPLQTVWHANIWSDSSKMNMFFKRNFKEKVYVCTHAFQKSCDSKLVMENVGVNFSIFKRLASYEVRSEFRKFLDTFSV